MIIVPPTERTNERRSACRHRQTDQPIDKPTNQQTNKPTDRRTDGQTNRRTDEPTDVAEQPFGWMAE